MWAATRGGVNVDQRELMIVNVRNGSAMLERELKFEADSVQVESLPGEPLQDRSFVSVYYDTDDGDLLRAGVSLRRRTENGRSVWQLKVPRPDGRFEIEEGGGGPAGPPDNVRGLLRALLRRRAVSPVATLRTHRSGRAVGETVVTLDQVDVLDGARVVGRFAEVEAELSEDVDGDVLRTIERELREVGARATDGRSKLQRALDASGKSRRPMRRVTQKSGLDRFRAYAQAQFDQLVSHDPGVRIFDDPEDVHDMRVAIRRLRAALRAAAPMLEPEWAGRLREELGWLADALAPVRDADVLTAHLEQEIGSLSGGDAVPGATLLQPLKEERQRAREALLRTLESDRYLTLLDEIEAAAQAPPSRRADIRLDKRARREFRKLEAQMRSLGANPSSASLHKARIRAKRARYATELASGDAKKAPKRFVKAAKAFQDVLGEHQDAIVAEQKLRQMARTTSTHSAALVAGRLIERQHRRAANARAALPKFWRQLTKTVS